MKLSFLPMLGILLAVSQTSDDVKYAIAEIEKTGGMVTVDSKQPGQPVVAVNL